MRLHGRLPRYDRATARQGRPIGIEEVRQVLRSKRLSNSSAVLMATCCHVNAWRTPSPPGVTHEQAPFRITQHVIETIAERLRIAGWHQIPGLPIGDGEGDAADA